MIKPPSLLPQATYRVQLRESFNFDALKNIVTYLKELGISHVYISPPFLAYPGSTHGYDVNDLNQINPELGGMSGLKSLSECLHAHEMGLIVDFVPNHMGILGPNNWRWINVLENGRNSPYAQYFDIQWNPREASLKDRVLIPILDDFYGKVLESGQLQLWYKQGALGIDYQGQKFPLCSESYGKILERLSWKYEPGSEICRELENLVRQFKLLVRSSKMKGLEDYQNYVTQRDKVRDDFSRLVEEKNLHPGLDWVFNNINGTVGQSASFDALHEILEEQYYRLAYWKLASYEINYRRFFAIDTLVGLKMEHDDVFIDCHQLLYDLLKSKVISGIRLDFIDGLWDPTNYLERLHALTSLEEEVPYIIVEKILTPGETLPSTWPVHGTTGYDFMASVINALTNGATLMDFNRIYTRFTNIATSPDEQMYEVKKFIIEELFPNILDNLSNLLSAQIKADRNWRDFAVNELRDALKNILACMPVYRTYRRSGLPPDENEIRILDRAANEALNRNSMQDSAPYEFIRNIWIRRYPGDTAPLEDQAWADQWILHVQQISGAVMAKSIEDTFFYRYVRLFSSNEVGHDPREFGPDISHFHESNLQRLKLFPNNLLSTSTHDTKMSEDVRARIMALSEIPGEWEFMIQEWKHLNEAHKTKINELAAPDANEEYLLYQILLGACPLDGNITSEGFKRRIREYFLKAISEAKINTSWNRSNQPWEQASNNFIDKILAPDFSQEFLTSFDSFSRKIMERGMMNSLVQVTLKLTSPGIPDIYQGNELWDYSLVDPDNRRLVDYDYRKGILKTLPDVPAEELIKNWKDGRIKMWVTHRLLQLRAKEPDLFSAGSYLPLSPTGELAQNTIVYLRKSEKREILVIVPRLLEKFVPGERGTFWRDTEVRLPENDFVPGPWLNIFTGQKLMLNSSALTLSSVLETFPLAVLSRL